MLIIRAGKLRPEAQAHEDIAMAAMRESDLRDQLAAAKRRLAAVEFELDKLRPLDPADLPEPNPRLLSRPPEVRDRYREVYAERDRLLFDVIEPLEERLAELVADKEASDRAANEAEAREAAFRAFQRQKLARDRAEFEAWEREQAA